MAGRKRQVPLERRQEKPKSTVGSIPWRASAYIIWNRNEGSVNAVKQCLRYHYYRQRPHVVKISEQVSRTCRLSRKMNRELGFQSIAWQILKLKRSGFRILYRFMSECSIEDFRDLSLPFSNQSDRKSDDFIHFISEIADSINNYPCPTKRIFTFKIYKSSIIVSTVSSINEDVIPLAKPCVKHNLQSKGKRSLINNRIQ